VTTVNDLRSAGFGPFFFAQLRLDEIDPSIIGRVVFTARKLVRVRIGDQELLAHAREPVVVGDWAVALPGDPRVIERVLDRKTALRRRDPNDVSVQILAANVDRALICCPCDQPPNVRRLERWLAVAADAGIDPVVLLTKADVGDPEAAAAAYRVVTDAPIVAISALTGVGREALMAVLEPGTTATLLGLSGAGKSTLVNFIVGENVRATADVRDGDHRGRHTTTDRHLFHLANGAWLLDNPGVRAVGVVGDEGVAAVFADVEEALAGCRWGDCTHDDEPECGILAAIDEGRLTPGRFAAWKKLQKELAFEIRKDDRAARRAELERWKRIHKAAKARRRFDDRQRGGS